MNKKTHSPQLEIAALLISIIAAGVLYRIHAQQRYFTPVSTTSLFFSAASRGDLAGLQEASTFDHYSAFVRYFGAPKYQRVQSTYQYAFRLGMPQWQEYRSRADGIAEEAYRRLHETVATLGRDAFTKLSVQERMALMDDRSKYDAFTFDQGIQALPAEDRGRIVNVEDFRQGRDRSGFALREGWNLLSDADRSALGSPAALSPNQTPEKIAFVLHAGIPLLNKEAKGEIDGIEWTEVNDPEPFKFKYGAPIAQAYLAEAKIPAPTNIQPCTFPTEQLTGSLLKGDIAHCVVAIQAAKQTFHILLILRKFDFRWLVESVQPDLYNIPWQVNHGSHN